MNQVKNFAIVYAKKSRRKNKKKSTKLDKKLKLYRSYSTIGLAANAIIEDPEIIELSKNNNIYIIEIVEEEESNENNS